jgi:NTP pyrophosphatase (non-canonical NTP hydrolase)
VDQESRELATRESCIGIVANLFIQNSFNSFYPDIRPATVDIQGRNSTCRLTLPRSIPTIATHGSRMPKRKFSPDQNVIPFPDPETASGRVAGRDHSVAPTALLMSSPIPDVLIAPAPACEIVLSGTYRKDVENLKRAYEEFKDLGCTILSPTNVSVVSEVNGFVYMKGEETEAPDKIEGRHLAAIQKANFVWLHAPDGYVGPTAALEVGFANAVGVPVFAQQAPKDKVLQSFVRLVDSPSAMVRMWPQHPEPPAPALKAFQEYYKRAALQRGYGNEGPKECLLLMVEEVGELARAIRKREKLVRHGAYNASSEAHELADVFLYVVHMANVLGLDLGGIVQEKEFVNVEKFLAR